MSLNEEKDGEDPNNLAIPQNVQDELASVIHMSLNNIATQIDNLNKRAEGLLAALSKEVDTISCRYNTLQERVIQLNNGFTVKEISKDSSLQAIKLKSSQSASIQTELDYPSNLFPDKIYESHDVSVQTSFYMSILHYQDAPQFLAAPKCQEDTESLITPYNQDDLMVQCRQDNKQNLTDPYCRDNDQDLAVSPKISYYFETCEEKFVSGIKDKVPERFRRKNQHVGHPIEPENGPRNTLMGNNTMGHTPPSSIERSHPHVDPPAECSAFSTYPINQISKALTQAVGKVLSSPPRPQKKEIKFQKEKESYVRYGVGKKEIKPPVRIQNHPKLEVFVSPAAPAPRTALPPDGLAMLRNSKAESPASKVHSQTQFPSPILRTSSAAHRHNYFQTCLEVGIQTAEVKEDCFSFPSSPPECYNLLKQDQGNGESTPMSTSPVLLRRIEAKEKCSDLLVHTSLAQSPKSLVYPPSRPLFPQSPRLSASKSPKPSPLSAPRFSCQPPTRYIGSAWSTASNAGRPRHSNLETCENSIPLAESFSQASRSSMSAAARCSSAYSDNHPVSPSHLAAHSSRFSAPSSGKAYIEESTNNLVPASQQSSSVKSTKSVTLQSLFSFPQSISSSVPSPHTLPMFKYSEDTVSSNPKGPPAFNKERSALKDSLRQGVLLHQTEEHCILKAQIEFSK